MKLFTVTQGFTAEEHCGKTQEQLSDGDILIGTDFTPELNPHNIVVSYPEENDKLLEIPTTNIKELDSAKRWSLINRIFSFMCKSIIYKHNAKNELFKMNDKDLNNMLFYVTKMIPSSVLIEMENKEQK